MEHELSVSRVITNDEFTYRDDFAVLLRRQGWHMTQCKPLYTDPQVVAIRRARHPLSLERGTSAWLGLLGDTTFRKLLRSLVNKPRTFDELLATCGDQAKLEWYLRMLEDGGLLTHSGECWEHGQALADVNNMGPTLEWYVAEWFRSELHAPARHGVAIREVPDGGDLDVVAFVNDTRVLVECKTSKPSHISETDLRWFLQRANAFNPEIALLLIDTDSTVESAIQKLNAIVLDMAWKDARLYNPSLPSDARLSHVGLVEQPGFDGVFWGSRHIYVVGTKTSIDTSLSAVLRLYYSKIRHLSFVGGDAVWDFVKGEVRKP